MDRHQEHQRGAKGIENIENISEDEGIAGSSESPEVAILHHKTSQYIRRAINSLPAKLRVIYERFGSLRVSEFYLLLSRLELIALSKKNPQSRKIHKLT